MLEHCDDDLAYQKVDVAKKEARTSGESAPKENLHHVGDSQVNGDICWKIDLIQGERLQHEGGYHEILPYSLHAFKGCDKK